MAAKGATSTERKLRVVADNRKARFNYVWNIGVDQPDFTATRIGVGFGNGCLALT
jgi:hypothetical protein